MTMKRIKAVSLAISVIMAMATGCVITTGVEAPDYTYTNDCFECEVTVEVVETGQDPRYPSFGVLVPIGWDADSVTYTGPNNGSMLYSAGISSVLEDSFPSASWDHWIGFQSDSIVWDSSVGDLYEVSVLVYTDDLIGTVDIAFLGMADSYFEGDPCSTTVEVDELNLEQSTWGSVKVQFGNQ